MTEITESLKRKIEVQKSVIHMIEGQKSSHIQAAESLDQDIYMHTLFLKDLEERLSHREDINALFQRDLERRLRKSEEVEISN